MEVIKEFVSSLSEHVGSKNDFKGIRLYSHLLNSVKEEHTKAVEKNIEIWTSFCSSNKEAILARDSSKLHKRNLKYSEKCKFNLYKVLAELDDESSSAAWDYLVVISVKLVKDNADFKAAIKQGKTGIKSKKTASMSDVQSILLADNPMLEDFMKSTQEKIQEDMDKSNSPQELIASLAASGKMEELLQSFDQGVSSGVISPDKLINTLVSNLPALGIEKSEIANILNSIPK